ncbi:MAG: hypothetical protein AAGU27_14520 [Dehalobacterium sp.]
MNKYTKILLVIFVIGAVIAIMFRPTGKLMTENGNTDYLSAYTEAKDKHMPVLIEFYGDY